MNKFYLLLILTVLSLTSIAPSQSETNHFDAGGIFELDLDNSEIPLTPKQEKEQKLLEELLEMKSKETKNTQFSSVKLNTQVR